MTIRADPLVSADWLKSRLGADDLRVVDASWHMPGDPRDAHGDHLKARIPGAVFFAIDEIADQLSPLPHMLPPPAQFSAQVGELGIGEGDRIVVYDCVGLFSAARVWWAFRAMGVDDVFVLDGGLPAWRAAGGVIEGGAPAAPAKRLFAARPRPELVCDLSGMRAAVRRGTRILDARARARFLGEAPEPRPGLRAGRMPGARSVPSSALLTETGLMRPRAELARLFEAAGVGKNDEIICTCGSGVSAAIIALALAHLGRWDASVYDGSWTEWGGRADTPVVIGDG